MPSFNRGDTFTFNLSAGDSVTWTGTANISYTPNGGTVQSGYVSGVNTTIGPFQVTTAFSVNCDTAGSYTINSNKVLSFSTRALVAVDDGKTFIPADSSQTATVNAGMPAGFGCAFNNNVTVSAGSGVTVTDKRTTGSTNPTCAIVNTGTNTYEVWGSKP